MWAEDLMRDTELVNEVMKVLSLHLIHPLPVTFFPGPPLIT